MNKKLIGVFSVAIVVIAILGLQYPKVQPQEPVKLGASPTLDGVDAPYVSINGLKYYEYNQNMTATSSVLCSVKNPFAATSTLLTYSAVVRSNGLTGAALAIDLATSTTAFGTSTPAFLKEAVIGSGVQGSLLYLPSTGTSSARIIGADAGQVGSTGANYNIIGPSEFVNLKISTTSTSGVFSNYLIGTCKGEFRQL